MSDNDGYAAADPWASTKVERSPSPERSRTPPKESRRSASPGGWGGGNEDNRGRSNYEPGTSNGGSAAVSDNPGNNLHVSGLAIKVTQRDLEEAFSKYGKIDKVQIMYDPHSKESRGFGFVTMIDSAAADAVISQMNGQEFFGKTMRIEKARRARARTPTPGRYFGPPKEEGRGPPRRGDDRRGGEKQYDPRPYDSRYAGSSSRYDDRRYDDYDRRDRYSDRRDDRYRDSRDYERSRYDERPRYDDRDRRDYPPRSSRDVPYVPGGGSSSAYRDDRRYDDRGSSARY